MNISFRHATLKFRLAVLAAFFWALSAPNFSLAQPAVSNSSSKPIAAFGAWQVMQKEIQYLNIDSKTGAQERGTYTACSAVMFFGNKYFEFEATAGNEFWMLYIGRTDWNFSPERTSLTITSGATSYQLNPAVYAGNMISYSSGDREVSQPVSVASLRSFFAQMQPISFFDMRDQPLVAFPNDNGDLGDAFNRAIQCYKGVL